MTPRLKTLAVLLPMLGALAGCGYGLVGRTSSLPADIQSIFVRPLVNQTTRPQVDLVLTRAIVDELITRRRFEVASRADDAHAVLSGRLTGFTARPIAFEGGTGRASEYEIQVTADMDFRRTDNDEVIWAQARYLFTERYEVELDQAAYIDLEDSTILLVAQEFAETLVIDLLEGF